MRHTRRLTTGERWELGLFLSMLIVGCLCFTAILNLPHLPRLFAFAYHSAPSTDAAAPRAAPEALPNLPALPMLAVPTLTTSYPTDPIETPALRPWTKRPAVDVKWFGGKKYRLVKTLRLRVTAYSPDERCCWPYPGTTTASGLSVKTNRGRLVAADTNLIPMHALVSVPGYASGAAVPVLDRGGAIKGHRLDVLMPTFAVAKEWGSRMIDVKIYMPLDD
jgi:3D (Asp-Asp-Asp) domain-containing protein